MDYRTWKIGLVYLEKLVQYTILTKLTIAVHLQYVKYKVQWTSVIGKYGTIGLAYLENINNYCTMDQGTWKNLYNTP